MGRAHAGNAAAAQDATTVFFNPAGMTALPQPEIAAGTNIIVPRIDFENRGTVAVTPGTLGMPVPVGGGDGGNPGSLTPVPHLYGVLPVPGERVWLGFAITAPFGLNAEYDDDWFGRYDSIESELLTIDVGPSVALRLNQRISIGGGLNIQYADAVLSNAIPNTLQPGGPSAGTDGLFKVSGDDFSIGFNIGMLFDATPSTRLGLHFRSGMDHTLQGSARTSGLAGPLAAANGEFDVEADVDLPAIVALAAVQEIGTDLRLYGELTWYDWSSFDEIRIEFDDPLVPDAVRPTDYRDTFALAIGAEYDLTQALTLRAGFQFDRTPTQDATRDTSLPDGDRYWISAGASYEVTDGFLVDLGLTHVFFRDGEIDLERTFFAGSPAAGTVRIAGEAETVVNTVALNLRYQF